MAVPDPLSALVARFERGEDKGTGLLTEFRRHVGRVAEPYPAAWFSLGQKGDEAVEDLTARVFTTCARVVKGRFPFLHRTPFAAFVSEAFDGRAIRYHSFYAKLSITRELMRADYAHNLSSDPRLVWRADLYGEIGDVLRRIATPDTRRPPRWALSGPTPVRASHLVIEALQAAATRETNALVPLALRVGGPRSQSELCGIIETVVGTPPAPAAADEAEEAHPWERSAIRSAVLAGWAELGEPERALLRGIADGLSYDELCVQMPAFSHRVAVNRALERIGRSFVARIAEVVGGEATMLPPRRLLELVLDVLGEEAS